MRQRTRKRTALILIMAIICLCCLPFGGCAFDRPSERVAYNISQEADNFNVQRRLTVINARTDKVLLQMIGYMALQNNSDNELEVICKIGNSQYQKHMIYLNDWTMYTVEDLSGANVSKYNYEIHFMPKSIADVRIKVTD